MNKHCQKISVVGYTLSDDFNIVSVRESIRSSHPLFTIVDYQIQETLLSISVEYYMFFFIRILLFHVVIILYITR